MMYSLSLVIENPQLFELLKPEIDMSDRGRSATNLRTEHNKTFIDIKAQDAVALRATIDSIIQLLIVYEKTGKIK